MDQLLTFYPDLSTSRNFFVIFKPFFAYNQIYCFLGKFLHSLMKLQSKFFIELEEWQSEEFNSNSQSIESNNNFLNRYHSISWKHPEWKEIIGENTFDQQFFEVQNVLSFLFSMFSKVSSIHLFIGNEEECAST